MIEIWQITINAKRRSASPWAMRYLFIFCLPGQVLLCGMPILTIAGPATLERSDCFTGGQKLRSGDVRWSTPWALAIGSAPPFLLFLLPPFLSPAHPSPSPSSFLFEGTPPSPPPPSLASTSSSYTSSLGLHIMRAGDAR